MTTLVLNYSQSLLERIFNGLKKTLQGFMVGWMIARQSAANATVAEQMIRAGEYRNEDYHWLLANLNARTIASIRKEFLND